MIDLSSKSLTGKLGENVDLSNLPSLQALWLFNNPNLRGVHVCSACMTLFGGVRRLTSGAVLQAHAHAVGWAHQCHCMLAPVPFTTP